MAKLYPLVPRRLWFRTPIAQALFYSISKDKVVVPSVNPSIPYESGVTAGVFYDPHDRMQMRNQ